MTSGRIKRRSPTMRFACRTFAADQCTSCRRRLQSPAPVIFARGAWALRKNPQNTPPDNRTLALWFCGSGVDMRGLPPCDDLATLTGPT